MVVESRVAYACESGMWSLLSLSSVGHCFHEAVLCVCCRDSVVLVPPYKANLNSSPAKASASGMEEESIKTSTSV